MQFSKDFLADMGGDTVQDIIIGHGRWSVHHERAFKHEGRFYRTTYRVGATESQDEQPYEYAAAEVECEEVVPVQKTVTVYEPVKANDALVG